MASTAQRRQSNDPLFASYAELAEGLLGALAGVCLLDGHWRVRGSKGRIDVARITQWTAELGWNGTGLRQPVSVAHTPGEWTTAIPLEQSDTTLLGVFCIQQSLPILPTYPARHAADVAARLKPLLDCVHRELAAALPTRERVQTLTERTRELEWLFKITSELKSGVDEGGAIRQLLAAATERMQSVLGFCEIPDKRLCIDHVAAAPTAAEQDSAWNGQEALRGVWRQTRQHLLNWATRRNSPLVVNSSERPGERVPRCKILSVPVVREGGRVIGILAFFNPPTAPNYASRHVYLARHLGSQAATVIDMQYDLMTGLYTRSALEQIAAGAGSGAPLQACLIYLDVDGMNVVNEAHGFEIGNEVLVRVADLLCAPILPDDALAARLSGDRFVVLLPDPDVRAGLAIARGIQGAIRDLKVGPVQGAVAVSVSCGVATVPAVPRGFERAIAVAETACKAAKSRGPGQVEVHADDGATSGAKRAGAAAVGRLRAALQEDRLRVTARRTRSLKDGSQPGSYDLAVELHEDGARICREELRELAERHHFSAPIDLWCVKRSLALLAPYRAMLKTRELGITLHVGEDTLRDAAFVDQLATLLPAAALPRDCLTVAIREEVAARGLVHARHLAERLRSWGCRLALTDCSMAKDALMHIRALGISRLTIASSVSQAGVRSIVEFAASLRLQTVAQCDTAQSLEVTRELGVDFAFGDAVESAGLLDEVLKALGEEESRRLGRLYLEL